MADATEDIPSADQDVDLSDETQDFRFLSHLASYDSTSTTLPRRGEKDFEPNPTLTQAHALESARQAMHSALSYPRLHLPKNHVIGTFDPESGKTVVRKPKGIFTRTMGVAQRDKLLLLPEEALYLLERGSLDVRWPEDRGMGLEEDGDVPMSLQGAYAAMMGTDGLTMERFVVYSSLKRAGYTIVRAPTWGKDGIPPNYVHLMGSGSRGQGNSVLSLIPRLFNWLRASSPKSCPSFGPLVAPGLYRNYSESLRTHVLNIIDKPQATSTALSPSFRPTNPLSLPQSLLTLLQLLTASRTMFGNPVLAIAKPHLQPQTTTSQLSTREPHLPPPSLSSLHCWKRLPTHLQTQEDIYTAA
jgi:tRNA-splicing endonuclease subunit Sen54